ncbi:MAG: DNA/RNA non-specific endonuclease [Bryobacterales bacterium]|nr:DNA/RNA non-specific endonuclease [Bryobacterales bacterium]
MDRLNHLLRNQTFRREVRNSRIVSEETARNLNKPTSFAFGFPATAEAPAAPEMALPGHEEAVVLLQGRPALLVRNNTFEMPRSGMWAERLFASRALIEARLPSIGRVEVDDGAGTFNSGTAWLIAPGVVATNRHVAEIFARRAGGEAKFLLNFQGRPYRTRVDFLEEYLGEEEREIRVEKVLFMEDSDRSLPDIAFLKLATSSDLPSPIPVSGKDPEAAQPFALVGYPAYDPRYGLGGLEAAKEIFGTIYDVKRLSPGEIMLSDEAAWYLLHDATTLGGNSGSVMVDLESGHAIGMHFKGDFRRANYAVKPARLLDYAAKYGITAEHGKPLPPPKPAAAEPEGAEEAPSSYSNRTGFSETFLGSGLPTPLPSTDGIEDVVLTFTDPASGSSTSVLKYTNFSVVMNQDRRMCIYSAVNINGLEALKIPRGGGWKFDSRIPQALQIKGECYGHEHEGKFSRGHMTRREDPNWGTRPVATRANSDTFHVTNACPQIQPFNGGIWLRLEEYALDNAVEDGMRISVYTGPVFRQDDPDYFGVQVPVEFWKVIAFRHDETKELTATGYKMSQRSFLPGQEFVYGRYETYQVSLKEIETLTGLSFGVLTDADPLRHLEEAPMRPLRATEQIRWS